MIEDFGYPVRFEKKQLKEGGRGELAILSFEKK